MKELLGRFHAVSQLAQADKTVTCSLVPYWVYHLEKWCIREEDESDITAELKAGLLSSIKKRISYYCTTVNNCLKAAALDPRVSDMTEYGITSELAEQVWEAVGDEQIGLIDLDNVHVSKMESKMEQIRVAVVTVRSVLEVVSKQYFQDNGIPGKGVERNDDGVIQTDIDPLMFWKEITNITESDVEGLEKKYNVTGIFDDGDKYSFGYLEKTARMLLSIPAGSALRKECSAVQDVSTPNSETLSVMKCLR